MKKTTEVCIEDLVRDKLLGRRVRGVSFVNDLLNLADEVGEIRCRPAGRDRLQFLIPDRPPAVEVAVDAAVGKLRMLCARLAKLRQDSGEEFEPYGGEGVITRAGVESSAAELAAWLARQSVEATRKEDNGRGPLGFMMSAPPALTCSRERWRVRYKNTMGQQEFTIIAD